jgi:hypothetical protein
LKVLVDKDSAVHCLSQQHEIHSFNRDHSNLVKFRSTDHECHWIISYLGSVKPKSALAHERVRSRSERPTSSKRKADDMLPLERQTVPFRQYATNMSSESLAEGVSRPSDTLLSPDPIQSKLIITS